LGSGSASGMLKREVSGLVSLQADWQASLVERCRGWGAVSPGLPVVRHSKTQQPKRESGPQLPSSPSHRRAFRSTPVEYLPAPYCNKSRHSIIDAGGPWTCGRRWAKSLPRKPERWWLARETPRVSGPTEHQTRAPPQTSVRSELRTP
jgi:hypothetical protein